jgi:hypothetical protein
MMNIENLIRQAEAASQYLAKPGNQGLDFWFEGKDFEWQEQEFIEAYLRLPKASG